MDEYMYKWKNLPLFNASQTAKEYSHTFFYPNIYEYLKQSITYYKYQYKTQSKDMIRW